MRRGFIALSIALIGCGSEAKTEPTKQAPRAISFEKLTLDTAYRVEGVGAFDVNGDGRPDIVTDQHWFDGKTLDKHELREPHEFDPATEFALGFGAYPLDVNGDGCVDIVAPPHPTDPFFWYENPCKTGPVTGRWKQHLVAGTGVAGLETPFLYDLFNDGKPVVLTSDSRAGENVLGFYEAQTTEPWVLQPISAKGFPGANGFFHGIGVGDLDGDGDRDVLTSLGWFENTGDRTKWIAHLEANTFPGAENQCSRMWTYDVNDDGLADILCSRPHGAGIHWLEQKLVSGARTFVDHVIDEQVSQMHALRLHDLDGDGVPEIVSGTRWCAHCSAGSPFPDPAIAYLVYYAIKREKGQVSFERHVIDEASGVGAAFDIADIDGDGKPDIVTANKKGLFYFRQR